MQLHALILLAALLQNPAQPAPQQPAPVPPQQPMQTPVWLDGGVQAPTQPTAQSSASVTVGPRVVRRPGKGYDGKVMATIESLIEVRGQEDNGLVGIGLVTGLPGTGDSIDMVRTVLDNLMTTYNIRIDRQKIVSENVALVRCEALLPPGLKPGQRIDVRVSTLGDCKSLEGGTLALTELTDISGHTVYATAGGPLTVGGYLIEAAAATAAKNITTVGILPRGGKVERAVESRIASDHGYIYLDARAAHGSFSNMARIADAVNAIYPGSAEALTDGRAVKVIVPSDLPESQHVAFLATILRREIEPDSVPRVVINGRTGVIVMGEGVRLRPGAVTFGDLTVTVADTEQVSQPGPFSNGRTTSNPTSDLNVQEDNNALTIVPGAVTLQEVVEVLNVLGSTPRDLINVLEAMSQAGLLLANIERM